MKYFLYSKISCFVKINGAQHEIKKNSPLEVSENDIVEVFSFDSAHAPYCIKISLPFLQECSCVKTSIFPKYLLIELLAPKLFNGECFITKKFSHFSVSIIGSPYKVRVDTGKATFIYSTEFALFNIDFIENNLIICILSQHTNIIFHKHQQKFYEICGQINFDNDKIIALSDCNTYARHGRLKTYTVTQSSLECTSSEAVYLNKKPQSVAPFLVQVAFFQAVREEDYNLAKTYLTDELAAKLSPQHFKRFFGQFSIVKPIIENNQHKIALLTQESSNTFRAVVFRYKMLNGKIADIIEDDLDD